MVLDFDNDNNANRRIEIAGGIPSKIVTVTTDSGGMDFFVSVGSPISINNIIREADTAHVKFKITTQSSQGVEWDWHSSAEMVKEGQGWKIKKEKVEHN